ncbi:F-box domain-containing protein [Heracleum sosnowskyi]|uniref:F-box domain-containing protein n=1 Tax=Heracleum sosnowskyi TaxID=360622 RepID=A0AAD8M6P3_9APIA|nr:F-box domain-containing protein [Heracleum sosnowskyi]
MKKIRSMSELPVEILTKIFLMSPPNSLVSCKAACKSFRNIIKNSNFARAHLTRFLSHYSPCIMLNLMYKPLHPYRESHHLLLSIDDAKNEIITSPFITNPSIPNVGEYDMVYVVGSCNGLICFSVWYDRGKEYDLLFILWNLVSGETRFLPKPKYSPTGRGIVTEFGFIPETNDYVVVKLDGLIHVRGEVYKMSTDSWTDIDCNVVKDYVQVERDGVPVFLNGCFHWRALGYGSNYMVNYKLVSEEVGVIKGHDVVELDDWELTTVEESLAMLFYDPNIVPHKFELWVMDDYQVDDSWVLRYRIVDDGCKFLCPVGCLGNGLMITYERDYYGVYLLDMKTGQKTKISAVPYGWSVTGFSKFSGSLVP